MSYEQRISRHVIAEQHLALTETFHSSWHFPHAFQPKKSRTEFIGEVFLRCNAKEVVERCAATVRELSGQAYGPNVPIPEVKIHGHLTATLTYIPAHLEYIIGELLRNSVQAAVEQRRATTGILPPIEVLICETPQHVIFRISDHGGGVSPAILPHLWSFVKGSRRHARLENLSKITHLSANLQEMKVLESEPTKNRVEDRRTPVDGSLRSLTGRPPNLRLGIGLSMSRVYAEYWAGSLELHSLEGYGVDAFLQISKLGNKNEQLSTRATMDGL